jgi:hypothetical protein
MIFKWLCIIYKCKMLFDKSPGNDLIKKKYISPVTVNCKYKMYGNI